MKFRNKRTQIPRWSSATSLGSNDDFLQHVCPLTKDNFSHFEKEGNETIYSNPAPSPLQTSLAPPAGRMKTDSLMGHSALVYLPRIDSTLDKSAGDLDSPIRCHPFPLTSPVHSCP